MDLLTSAPPAQALSLFQQAVSEGHFRQQRWEGSESHRAEVNLHAMTAGVAMLSLYTWLMSLKQVPNLSALSLLHAQHMFTDKPRKFCTGSGGALLFTVGMMCLKSPPE